MKLREIFGSNSTVIGAVAIGAMVVIASAIGVTLFDAEDVGSDDPGATPSEVSSAAPSDIPDATAAADPAGAGATSLPATALDPLTITPQDPAIAAPRLDLVRVAPNGDTVIAGRTSPDLPVAVLLDGIEVDLVRADGAGNFVALLTVPPSETPRVLAAEARPEGAEAVAGTETVLIAPFATPEGPMIAQGAVETPEGLAAAGSLDPPAETPLEQPTEIASAEPAAPGNADAAGLPLDPASEAPVEAPASAPVDGPTDMASEAPVQGPAQIPEEEIIASPDAADLAAADPVVPVPDTADLAAADPVAPVPDTADLAAADPTAPVPDAADLTAADPTAPGPTVADPAAADPAAPVIASAVPDAPSAPAVGAAPNSPGLSPAAPRPVRAANPAVIIGGPDGLRVVQGSAPGPAVQTSVRLDAISYNAEGAVILSGRGPAAADIQIYINNQPIELGEIGPGGDWSVQLPDVDPGTYTLAVAEITADGTTASRVETPFLREDPERIAQAPTAAGAGIDVITVQPGFTLWGMAENTFGSGILYVQIFEENRDQIRDPHWIFPGQIFRMPELGTEQETALPEN